MSELAAAIEARIAEFLASQDPRDGWLKDAVRRHGFLPSYRGWFLITGVRRDGSAVAWNEETPESPPALLEGARARLALCQAAVMYPELVGLVPVRPSGAESCTVCSGTGRLPGSLICSCGGAGWIIPGEETRGPDPG
jgi:hypothetical protein